MILGAGKGRANLPLGRKNFAEGRDHSGLSGFWFFSSTKVFSKVQRNSGSGLHLISRVMRRFPTAVTVDSDSTGGAEPESGWFSIFFSPDLEIFNSKSLLQ